MSQENVKPDQIQASVAAALSRLRGDLAPPSDAPAETADAAAQRPAPAQPANDLRAEPGFKPIPPGVTPQAGAEPTPPSAEPELPRAMFSRTRFVPPSTPDAPPPTVQRTSGPLARMMTRETPQAAAPAAAEPAPAQPAAPAVEQQPDLLAGLPPPPLSDTLTEDTEAAIARRRRNRRILVLSVALVAALGALWGWTKMRSSTKDVPVIAADSTPEKVKPADEGGLQVPNQNVQVLDNMDSNQPTAEAETVLPPPEQPVTPPAPTVEETQPAPEAATTETTDNSAATVQDVPAIVAPEPPAVEAPAADASAAEQPASEQATAEQAAPAPEAPAPEPSATQEAATPTPAPEPAPAPAATEQQPAAATPEPAATQEAAVAPAPAPAAGNARIQLAAVKSEAAAKEEWAKLQKSYPDLLGSLTLTVQKVDKGAAGIFYRIQAGPLADKGAAKQLCASLKKHGQDCLVAK